MIEFGSVIWVREVHFENTGHTTPKYIVVLSDLFEDHYVCVVLTSQERKWRYRSPGCNPEKGWFYIGANHPLMTKATWADLSESQLFEGSELMQRCMTGAAQPQGKFEYDLTVAIADCFARTEDVTDFDREAMGYPLAP